MNLAHKGDVIISTSVLPLIKKKYPKSKIGFLVGSWSEEVLKNHPLINFIHIFDHPKLNRSKKSIFYRLYRGFFTFKSAKKSIMKEVYDVSVDLYLYYPNSHFLMWRSQIPKRVGYITGGGERFLTDCFYEGNDNLHMSVYGMNLLKAIGINLPKIEFFKPFLPKPETSIEFPYKDFWIFHPYSGNRLKDWKDSSWRDLALHFTRLEKTVVFTGGSLEEKEKIDVIINGIAGCYNVASKVSFENLKKLIIEANGIVCVDTMIGHLAAAYDQTSIIICSNQGDFQRWKPASKKSFVIKSS